MVSGEDRPIFVFTASNQEARNHYHDTIERPIKREILLRHLDAAFVTTLESKGGTEVYAWGATPGSGNKRIWRQMIVGDYVVAYIYKRLRSLLQITATCHSKPLALDLWGTRKRSSGSEVTWEYIYFLRKIADFDLPSPRRFQGHIHPRSEIAGEIISIITATLGDIFTSEPVRRGVTQAPSIFRPASSTNWVSRSVLNADLAPLFADRADSLRFS